MAVLLISNLAALKVIDLGGWIFDGGALLFPLAYIFGDILTEVYGYRKTRTVIWTGFFWLLVMNGVLYLTAAAPPEAHWNEQVGQHCWDRVLGISPRIAAASLVGYFWGEFCNSFLLAKMKVWTEGRHLWLRTIGSTVVGHGVDTLLFCTIAFWGILPWSEIWTYTLVGYGYKTGVEVVMTPVTYKVVAWLKETEGVDAFDRDLRFNPFLA